MDHNITIQKLLAVTKNEWENIIGICYTHLKIKLYKKTIHGAHSETRLGLHAYDFYLGEAVTALYKGRWEWKYDLFVLHEQLIRIMDSMISEQVRKFKVEKKQTKYSIRTTRATTLFT